MIESKGEREISLTLFYNNRKKRTSRPKPVGSFGCIIFRVDDGYSYHFSTLFLGILFIGVDGYLAILFSITISLIFLISSFFDKVSVKKKIGTSGPEKNTLCQLRQKTKCELL